MLEEIMGRMLNGADCTEFKEKYAHLCRTTGLGLTPSSGSNGHGHASTGSGAGDSCNVNTYTNSTSQAMRDCSAQAGTGDKSQKSKQGNPDPNNDCSNSDGDMQKRGTAMTPPPPPPRTKPPISVNTTNHGTSPMHPSTNAGRGSSNVNSSADGWQEAGPRTSRKQQLSGAPKGPAKRTPLTGAGPKPKTTDLYVLNISRCDSDRMIDIANRVREHCKANDIRVTFVRVFPRKYSLESVNVKISVVLEDVDKALGIHIWPDNVSCRRWNKDPPQRNNNGGGRATGQHNSWNSQEGQEPRGRRMSRSRSRGRGRSASSVRFTENSYSNDDQYYDAWNDTYRALNGYDR